MTFLLRLRIKVYVKKLCYITEEETARVCDTSFTVRALRRTYQDTHNMMTTTLLLYCISQHYIILSSVNTLYKIIPIYFGRTS